MEEFSREDIIDMLPVSKESSKIAQDIVNETDDSRIKQLTQLFNLNQAKKNVLRVLKLNCLLDKVSDQMLERFEKRPGEFSNADLLNYMTVTQNAIDRANKSLNLVNDMPAIQINQVNNTIVNSEDTLDRESKERIMDAVNAILNKAKELNIDISNSDSDTEIIVDDDTVYSNDNLLKEED